MFPANALYTVSYKPVSELNRTRSLCHENTSQSSMAGLSHYLDSISDSSNSLKTLYFRPPGIFTNAIIRKPDITTLLRDANSHENALYHVDKQGVPERRDGTRGAVDRLNYEFEQMELQQQLNDSENNNSNIVERPAVVVVPKEPEQPTTSEYNKGVKNLLSRFNEENQTDYGVDVLGETVRQLLEKYPIDGVEQELQEYIQRWKILSSEVMQHEETLEKQRRQLSALNVSLDRDYTSAKTPRSAAELIREEEEEIRRLELELCSKSKGSDH